MGSERIHGWLKCCRLCLMDDGVKMPIFGEEGIHREVAKKIESCLPIVIYNSDPLSKLICQRCLFMLDTVYDFHQKCVQTTVVLTNQLLAIKNSSAVTVYLLSLEKNDLLACSSSGKEPKRKHPTPDQIPAEEVLAVSQPPVKDYTDVQVKQEVPQIVNVVGSYGGELRRRSHPPPLSQPEVAATQIKQEPGTSTSSFKRVTPWFCKFCNKYYKNKGTLYKHRKYFCSKKGFECHKCNKVFAVEHDKLVHLATHLRVYVDAPESQLVSCSQCDKRFLNKQMLESHLRVHRFATETDGSESQVPALGAEPDSESDVSVCESPATVRESESERFPCEYCPRTYAQKGKLNRHQSEEHRAEMFPPIDVASLFQRLNRPSPLSKKKLPSSSSTTLLRELLLKQQGPVPKCEQCNKPFESRQGLSNHMRIHLPKNQKVSQKCLDCGKMFGSREGLRYHTNKFHRGLGQNKHHCRICETSFTSRSEWLLHMVTHPISGKKSEREESPPKAVGVARRKPNPPMLPSCIYCDQEFDEVPELTDHLSEVHGLAKHYPCGVCFKLFAHRSNMARHQKIHQRTNQYTFHPCNVCGKKFLSKETAEKHASMHVPSQTFHCPQCNKIFFKMEGLHNHACNPGGQSEDSNDCPSCNFPYTKGHECRYREDGSRIMLPGNKAPKKKKKKPSQLRTGRSYKCKHCAATFTSSYSHNSHMKIHTGLYRAKHKPPNVILSVPSFVQPHHVEVKAEPLEELGVGENSFTWMHPKNLEADVKESCVVAPPHEHKETEPTAANNSDIDTLDPLETGHVDGRPSVIETLHPQDNTSHNNSEYIQVRPQETMSGDNTYPNNTDYPIQVRPQETMSVENTSPINTDYIQVRPQETMSVDKTSPNNSEYIRVHPQETVSVDKTSPNTSDYIRVRPHESMSGDNSSPINTDYIRVRPHESMSGDNTSPNSSDYIRVRPQETMSGDNSSPNNTDFIRVRPHESMSGDMVNESKHEGGARPQELERVDRSHEVDRPSMVSFRGDTGFTESSTPFTANHSQDRGSTSCHRYSQAPRGQEEIYGCNICDKSFSTPEELTTHVRWHGNPNKMPFKCPFCERGFVNSPAVYQHVLMNHKEQRY